ncbi:MAG: cytochrome c [Sediminibacterium sp.]|nr:cytochrome c [Sediminibacterium sp.]
MNAVGTDNKLTPEEITAIINYEKTSWGNNAKTVNPEEVKKIIAVISLFTVLTFIYSTRYLLRPGENDADHIKQSIL